MSRARPALALAALLVLSLSGPGSGLAAEGGNNTSAPGPLYSPGQNVSNVLAVGDDPRTNVTSAGLSVTRTLQMQRAATSSAFTERAVSARLDAAETPAERREVLLNVTDRLSDAVDRLRARERAARRAYLAGERTAREYLATLAVLDARARELKRIANFVGERAEDDSVVMDRVNRIRAELVLLTGPLRSQAARALRGGDGGDRVFLAATDAGVALSDVRGETFRREAVRPGQFDPPAASIDAIDRASELYPWAWTNYKGRTINYLDVGPYAFFLRIFHEHGRIISYVDTSTGAVYDEDHAIDLESYPTSADITVTENNTSLAVDRTYAGGPLRVTVTNATGAPVEDARVFVDGAAVGRTGEDGGVWSVGLAGTYNVSAVRNGTRLNVTVSAVPSEG